MTSSLFFTLILTFFTIFTGIFWIFNKFNKFIVNSSYIKKLSVKTIDKVDKKIISNLTKIPTWIKSISSYFPVLFFVFFFRSFIYEPFQIPSGSMMPTLLTGDFILVEKFSYGIKNPITQSMIISIAHPKRGDVVVFKYPKNKNLFYIKRVIGLPGDLIIYNFKNKTINIYSNCYNKYIKTCINNKSLTNYSNVLPSNFIQTFNNMFDRYSNNFFEIPIGQKILNGIRLSIRNESIDDSAHSILLLNDRSLINQELYYHQDNYPKNHWVVPNSQYFMMGDNRDNSSDSRYWGFVSEKDLIGKATIIWMSFDTNNIFKHGIRIKRIGKIN